MSSTRKDARWALAMVDMSWDEWDRLSYNDRESALARSERALNFMSEEAIEELARQWNGWNGVGE